LIDNAKAKIDMFIQWGIYQDGNGANIYNHLKTGKNIRRGDECRLSSVKFKPIVQCRNQAIAFQELYGGVLYLGVGI